MYETFYTLRILETVVIECQLLAMNKDGTNG